MVKISRQCMAHKNCSISFCLTYHLGKMSRAFLCWRRNGEGHGEGELTEPLFLPVAG